MSEPSSRDADLVIVGGGLVGASLAVAACSHPISTPLSVVLIDPSPPPASSIHLTNGDNDNDGDEDSANRTSHWPPISLRTSTINPSTQEFLSDIGVWSRIPESRLCPIDSMVVWEHAYSEDGNETVMNSEKIQQQHTTPAMKGVMHFRASDIQEDILAYVVDNSTLRYALYMQIKHLVNKGKLTVLPLSVRDIHSGDSHHHHHETEGATGHSHGQGQNETDAADIHDDSIQWPTLELSDGSVLHARLIAACDGARSKVRTLAGADWIGHEYGQRAVVANVRVSDALCTAWQRFVDSGPVALLPIAGGEVESESVDNNGQLNVTQDVSKGKTTSMGGPMANIVWTMTEGEANALTQVDDHVFLDELNSVLSSSVSSEDEQLYQNTNPHIDSIFSQILSPLTSPSQKSAEHLDTYPTAPKCTAVVGKRLSFPLSAGHAPRYVIPERRTVLVGDAAHSAHPLAGQGVNLGFADARVLADCIATAAGAGRDIGGENGAPLRFYEGERMPVNIAAIAGLHGLRAAFSLRAGGAGGVSLRVNSLGRFAGSLRRAGLSVVNDIGPIKRAVLRLMR